MDGDRGDFIDPIVQEWRRARPDLDVAPMEVFARLTHIGALIDRRFLEHGIERREFDVLATLRRVGPPHRLTPSQLSSAVLAASGTMTGRLDRLAARGLIERSPNPADRRGVIVGLTAAGLELTDRLLDTFLGEESALLAVLGPADRRQLADLLRRLILELEPASARRGNARLRP